MFIRQINVHYIVPMFEQLGQSYTEMILPQQHSFKLHECSEYHTHADKHESLLQIDTMTSIGIVKHSQNSQNSKVTMYLQYIKKDVRNGVHFQLADKHQSFLQVDFNTLGIKDACKVKLSLLLGMIRNSQSTQSKKFAISLQYLEKRSQEGSSSFA